ncbi:MAG: hypothetical protein WC484_06505 [Candidatus Omnitrophota bacterium]|jgi:hypothetical protein
MNIETCHEYDRATFYKTNCDCMDNDHCMTVVIEYDDYFCVTILSIACLSHSSFFEVYSPIPWRSDYWYQRIRDRIKGAWRILTTGHISLKA